MNKFHDYVFVLWGDGFDEAVAVIFVTSLREAGLRVKVVGLTPRQISGSHGLALVPDLTLDQALTLANQAICLVIPATLPGIKRLKNDPRLVELFQQVQVNQAKFVIGQLNGIDVTELALFPTSTEHLVIYPDSEDLVRFVRELASSLSMVI